MSIDRDLLNHVVNAGQHSSDSLNLARRTSTVLKSIRKNLEESGGDHDWIESELQQIEELNDQKRATDHKVHRALNKIEAPIRARREAELPRKETKPIKEHITNQILDLLDKNNLKSGKLAEIGGSKNAFMPQVLTDFDTTFLSLFAESSKKNVVQADITDCDHVPDESFDVILSFSVLEHVDRPWLAAQNMTRLLKPGGITYHTMPFSYFYHEAPIDYWRCSPQCLAFLFSGLEPLVQEFYGDNRRRDNQGSKFNKIDHWGGPQFAVDAFGGWRENWHTIYAGRKPLDGEKLSKPVAGKPKGFLGKLFGG